MFEEVWNQLEQEAVTAWKNTHFQQVKYAMNEGMLLGSNRENCKKIMKRAKTKTVQNEIKWYSRQYGQTLHMEYTFLPIATPFWKYYLLIFVERRK